MSAPTTPAAKQRETSIRDFLRVVFRRKWIIVTIFGVSTGTVVMVNATSKVLYESTASVLVNRGEKQGIFEPGYKLLPREEDIASEVELVASEPVFRRAEELVKERRAAAGKPALHIHRGAITGAVKGESNVVEVNYLDEDAAVCQDAANAVTDAYIEYRERMRSLPAVDTFFTREIRDTQASIDRWQAARAAYLSSNGMLNTESERATLIKQMDDQTVVIAEIDRTLRGIEAEQRDSRRLVSTQPQVDVPFATDVQVGNEAVIVELKRKLIETNIALSDAKAKYAPGAQPVVAAQENVDHLTQLLRTEVANRLRLLDQQAEVLRAKRAAASTAMGSLDSRLRGYPAHQQALADMDRTIEMLQNNYKELTGKYLQAQISKASTSPYFEVTKLTSASYPVAKNTKDYVRLALAPILSLAVGLGLAFFAESLDHSVATASDVEDRLGLPLLGSVRENA